MKKNFVIYQATCKITQKCYIGVTGNFAVRVAAHQRDTRKGSDLVFHRALRKYGIENFDFAILSNSLDEEYARNVLEPHFIKTHNTLAPNGYNISEGGRGAVGVRHPLTEKHKSKIAAAHRGMKYDASFGKIVSEAKKGKVLVSTETRQKLSLVHKGKPNPHTSLHREHLTHSFLAGYRNGRIPWNKKNVVIIHPNGMTETISNLHSFCIAHNIKYSTAVIAARHNRFIRAGYHFSYA